MEEGRGVVGLSADISNNGVTGSNRVEVRAVGICVSKGNNEGMETGVLIGNGDTTGLGFHLALVLGHV